ncbi:Aste57867_13836 [Aphanomyces stellatus]|uniref:Aste57867_13836 protein n=1 Tax=Aphanomyces stellatus TaxID=120398 RepID=A0A485KZ63_9STRA|nr:hypothetical protein As57867_013786 [Aphanomyces stellatus]VFT90668.1 Aste57867_13836 [Aphanomyces stellatus]
MTVVCLAVTATAMPDAFLIRVGLFAAPWFGAKAFAGGPPMTRTVPALASGGPTEIDAADLLAAVAHAELARVDLVGAIWFGALAAVAMEEALCGLGQGEIDASEEEA